ncbi:ribonuclease PH [Synergistaceae bacterium OttesenSCG-928-D05]|nr:ribonuclease PH [Synergistaceae bacterium OttesenSCG-928-D05]
MQFQRIDGREPRDLRNIRFTRGVNRYAEGSALVEWGETKVICTASVEDKAPAFLRGTGTGWVSAEYAMLPRSTHQRMQRDISKGKLNGRGSEIQRLIGRSLRAAVDMPGLGERTIWIDCDVLQADGGTRTASISAGFVALFDALRWLRAEQKISSIPLKTQIGAVSAGKVDGVMMLDLCYEEDSRAEVDANLIMTGDGSFVELQGTGEGGVFTRAELDEIVSLGWDGISAIHKMQRECLELTEEEKKLFLSC